MTLYEDLGITENATKEEIKKAYRELSKKHHPDKGGGDEMFQKISYAYEILSNPVEKKHYDETGSTFSSTDDVIRSELLILFNLALNAISEQRRRDVNLVDMVKEDVETSISQHEKVIRTLKLKKECFLSHMEKLSAIEGETDFITPGLKNIIDDMEKEIRGFRYKIGGCKKLLAELENYRYEHEEVPFSPLFSSTTSTSTQWLPFPYSAR